MRVVPYVITQTLMSPTSCSDVQALLRPGQKQRPKCVIHMKRCLRVSGQHRASAHTHWGATQRKWVAPWFRRRATAGQLLERGWRQGLLRPRRRFALARKDKGQARADKAVDGVHVGVNVRERLEHTDTARHATLP